MDEEYTLVRRVQTGAGYELKTSKVCLDDRSTLKEWEQDKKITRSRKLQTRKVRVDIDRAQQATVPIYHVGRSMEGYVTEKTLPEVKSRPSPVLSPDVWAWRPPQQIQTNAECDMKSMDDFLSLIPCDKCGEHKAPIDGYGNESPIIVWYCRSCDVYTGVDDTFTTKDAFELADLLASSLEKGTLQVDPCKGCGKNVNPELFTIVEVKSKLFLKCMCCDHREPMDILEGDVPGPSADFSNEDHSVQCGQGDEFVYVTKQDVDDMDPMFSSFSCKSDQTSWPSTAYTKVRNLSDLNPGDHIKFDRDLAFWHHAIVEGVDHKKIQIDVIHYSAMVRGHLGEIMRETISVNLKKDSLHRVDYERCHSTDTVLSRALSRIGEHKYNPFTNNCEHFAQWCKIGVSKSDQVQSFANGSFAAAAKVTSFAGLKMAAEEAGSAISMSTKIFTNSATNMARTFTKIDAAVTGVAIVVELITAGVAIGGYYKQKKGGEISGREFIRCTVKRVCQGAGGIIGSVLGNVIGNFTIPIVGGVVGATLGALIGEGVGRILGRQVSKLVRD